MIQIWKTLVSEDWGVGAYSIILDINIILQKSLSFFLSHSDNTLAM